MFGKFISILKNFFSQSYSVKTHTFSNWLFVNKAKKLQFFHFVTLQDWLCQMTIRKEKGCSSQE